MYKTLLYYWQNKKIAEPSLKRDKFFISLDKIFLGASIYVTQEKKKKLEWLSFIYQPKLNLTYLTQVSH